jgi:curved DNA-binding protein CbpA
MSTTDQYRTFGLAPGASVADIKKAFRQKALQLHPDQGGDAQAFLELKAAFEALVSGSAPANVDVGPGYDPFTDPDYHKRTFFAPENDRLAEFERMVRAQGCLICHGMGTISKWVDPSKGFMGREERFCKCQIV